MEEVKRLLGAFAVGGLLAVVGQAILLGFTTWLAGSHNAFVASLPGPLTLVSLGVIGGLLYLPRLYDKLEAISGYGAALPFSGFCVAIAHAVETARLEGGSAGKAMAAGVRLVLQIIGVASIGAFIIAAAAHAANTLLEPITFLAATLARAQAEVLPFATGSAAAFAGAFLVGGVVCLLFQAFGDYTGTATPRVLVLAMLVGGLLTPMGVIASLGVVGGVAGDYTAVGAGSAVTGASMALFAGSVAPLLTVLGVFCVLTVLGCLWGLARAGLAKQ